MLIKSQNVHLQISSFLPFHGPKLEWYSGYTDQVAWIIQSNFEINIMENKTTANFKKKCLLWHLYVFKHLVLKSIL